MSRYLLPILALAIAVLSLVSYCEGRAAGKAAITSAARADTIARLSRTLATRKAFEQVDTIRLRETTTRYVTLRDTIFRHRTDTLISIDTVRLLVAAADSTIHACRATITDCEARADAAEGIVAQQARQITALEHRTRRFWDRFGISAGYGLTATPSGAVVHGVQLGASVRLWP